METLVDFPHTRSETSSDSEPELFAHTPSAMNHSDFSRRQILQDAGCTVRSAEDGSAAGQVFSEENGDFDVVITDWRTPKSMAVISY